MQPWLVLAVPILLTAVALAATGASVPEESVSVPGVSAPTGVCPPAGGCDTTNLPLFTDEMGDTMFGNLGMKQQSGLYLLRGGSGGGVSLASNEEGLAGSAVDGPGPSGMIVWGAPAAGFDIMDPGLQGGTSWISADAGELTMPVSAQDTWTFEQGGRIVIADGSDITIEDGGDIIHSGGDAVIQTAEDFIVEVAGETAIYVEDTTTFVGINNDSPDDALDVNGTIIPHLDATYALGRADKRFTDLYLDSVIHHKGPLYFSEGEGEGQQTTMILDEDGNAFFAGEIEADGLDIGFGNSRVFGASVTGGNSNQAMGTYSLVAGGDDNTANGQRAAVVGGNNNDAASAYSAVIGGQTNQATGTHSIVAGGFENDAIGSRAGNLGGNNNVASGAQSAIVGGNFNTASGANAAILGGGSQTATGDRSTSVGAYFSDAIGDGAAVVGGYDNEALSAATYSVIAGGQQNEINEWASFVGGGYGNEISSHSSAIVGGAFNTASDRGSIVLGGFSSDATGIMSIVAGGSQHRTENAYSAVLGGFANTASGRSAVAMGEFSTASHANSFVWSDNEFAVSSSAEDSWKVFASGGSTFNSGSGTGVHLAPGSGSWASTSDVNMKRDFEELDNRQVLETIADLDISEWSYLHEGEVRHVGPTAQDFQAAFGLGASDTMITGVDADGINMAAIQGLYEIALDQQAEIEALKAHLDGGEASRVQEAAVTTEATADAPVANEATNDPGPATTAFVPAPAAGPSMGLLLLGALLTSLVGAIGGAVIVRKLGR